MFTNAKTCTKLKLGITIAFQALAARGCTFPKILPPDVLCIQMLGMHMYNKSECRWFWCPNGTAFFFCSPNFLPFCLHTDVDLEERGRWNTQQESHGCELWNSILLNVFFLSEACTCYFKCFSSLHRIEKYHIKKPGWCILHQLEKQMLPRGSCHQAQQWGGPRDHSSPSPLCTASNTLQAGSCTTYFVPKGRTASV